MAGCFPGGSCDVFKEPTKSQRDSYTDKLENVLNDSDGRILFKRFLTEKNFRDGLKIVKLWEKCNALIASHDAETRDRSSHGRFLRRVDEVIDDADNVDDIDFALMERLTIARDSENEEELLRTLKSLRDTLAKSLRREYNAFRQDLLKNR